MTRRFSRSALMAAISAWALCAQGPPRLTSISVTQVKFDVWSDMFSADFTNRSNTDVTAVSYEVVVTHTDGSVHRWRSSFDLMVGIALENVGNPAPGIQVGALHPGKAYQVNQPIQRPADSSQTVQIEVVPVAVVFLGGMAEGDEAQLAPLFNGRKAVALEADKWAKALTGVRTALDLTELTARAKAEQPAVGPGASTSRAGEGPPAKAPTFLPLVIQTLESANRQIETGQASEEKVISLLRDYFTRLAVVSSSESVRKEGSR